MAGATDNIVFVEHMHPKYLEGAISLSQHVYNGRKALTLIGETHTDVIKCPRPRTTVPTLIVGSLNSNPKARALLEFPPKATEEQVMRINSPNLVESVRQAKEDGVLSQIIPVDYRDEFITTELKDILYHRPDQLRRFTDRDVYERLVDPFYQKYRKFDLDPKLYSPAIYNYLQRTYLFDIDVGFKEFLKHLRSWPDDFEKFSLMLKHLWKKVVDYFILKEVLKNDDVNEYIILMGEEHAKNLREILKKVTVQLGGETQHIRGKKCFKLSRTFVF